MGRTKINTSLIRLLSILLSLYLIAPAFAALEVIELSDNNVQTTYDKHRLDPTSAFDENFYKDINRKSKKTKIVLTHLGEDLGPFKLKFRVNPRNSRNNTIALRVDLMKAADILAGREIENKENNTKRVSVYELAQEHLPRMKEHISRITNIENYIIKDDPEAVTAKNL